MKKHVVGFILFNLIVGTSAIIAALFYEMPKIDSVDVPETPVIYTRSCWRMRKNLQSPQVNAKITQAVFNENTDQLDMDLFLERKNHSTENVSVSLQFFVKDGNQTRYLATETFNLTPDFDLDDKAAQSVTFSYKWLDDLKSHENLYIVPQTAATENYTRLAPRFDEASAAPVTVVDGN